MRKLLLIVVVAFLASTAIGQSRASMPASRAARVHPSFAQSNRDALGISGARFGHFHGRGFRNPGLVYSWPYFADYYPGYSDSNEQPPVSQPRPAPAQPQASNEPLPAPSLLELQGNQWVKVNSFSMAATSMPPNQSGEPVSATALKEMPPAVLVYRDGHTEELTSYTIIGGSIHTKSDYWSNGAWMRTIQIADLDIPATLKQNQQHGVKFDLPSGPDEVIIRP